MADQRQETERSPTLDRNAAAIHQLEQQAMEREHTSSFARWFASLGGLVGSPAFVFLQVLGVALWVWANRPGGRAHFDPFPYVWLVLGLALEAIVISAIVLINQRQLMARAEARARVNLQFNLLIEAEITKVLKMMQELRADMGASDVQEDAELKEFAAQTEVQKVVEAIDAGHETAPPPATPPATS